MRSVPAAALVLSPREWATRLHRHAADHGGIRVSARVLRAEDALTEPYDVLVIDDITSFFSRRLVEAVHRQGRRVLGVFDEEDAKEARGRLLSAGVDGIIEAGALSDEFVRRIAETADGVMVRHVVAPAHSRPDVRVIVVGGPYGGTGSTEVAIGLARALVGRVRVALVDADDAAPSVAQRLGLPVTPNLRTAVDSVRRDEDLDGRIQQVGDLGIVPGIPSPRDWHELRSEDVLEMFDVMAGVVDVIVVDIASGIEDGPGVGRFRLARAMLARADVLVGVGVPTPVGTTRLVDWLAGTRTINGTAPVHLVMNRTPAGRFVKGQVAEELQRVFAPANLVFLPTDRRVEFASWQGAAVAGGPFVRAVESLARHIAREPVPV